MIATHTLSAVLVVIFGLQVAAGVPNSVMGAGLVKPLVAEGEWWRLLTACFMHINVIHLFANITGLQVFGGVIETRTSWRHLLVVYLISGVAGSVMSQMFVAAPSIGASGAVLGLVGFSLVLGYRHKSEAQRDLVWDASKALVLTGFLGAAMYQSIDNAAHAGGAFAGIGLGLMIAARSAVHGLRPVAGWVAALALIATAAGTGTLVVRSYVEPEPRVAQVTDHAPVPEARLSLKVWSSLDGVEYALTNVGTKGFTAWEVGFYADDGTRRVASLGGDVCRPVQERPGSIRPGQTHVESFRRVIGESRRALTARVDVVLIDGGGFSGSPSRYEAMLASRRHRLTELESTIEILETAALMPPKLAEVYLRSQVDVLASTAEKTRQPLIVSEILSARREAETFPDKFAQTVQRLITQTRRSAEAFRLCDAH